VLVTYGSALWLLGRVYVKVPEESEWRITRKSTIIMFASPKPYLRTEKIAEYIIIIFSYCLCFSNQSLLPSETATAITNSHKLRFGMLNVLTRCGLAYCVVREVMWCSLVENYRCSAGTTYYINILWRWNKNDAPKFLKPFYQNTRHHIPKESRSTFNTSCRHIFRDSSIWI